MRQFAILFLSIAAMAGAQSALAQISLNVANSGVETGAATKVPAGWTMASGQNPFWIGNSQVGATNLASANGASAGPIFKLA